MESFPQERAIAKEMVCAGLKRLESRLLFFLDVEKLVQLRDLKHLVNLRIDVAQNQLALGSVDLFVERDEFAEGSAGQVFDIAEIQNQFAAPELIDEAKQLFADNLDVLFIQDLLIRKVYDRDLADVLHFKSPATRL
jgi:hypothetical protein